MIFLENISNRLIEAMIRIYCKGNHSDTYKSDICFECNNLLQYAVERSRKCRWSFDSSTQIKPTCIQCSSNCYRPEYRDKIKLFMKYSGPRIFFHHPFLSLWYLKKKVRFFIFLKSGFKK